MSPHALPAARWSPLLPTVSPAVVCVRSPSFRCVRVIKQGSGLSVRVVKCCSCLAALDHPNSSWRHLCVVTEFDVFWRDFIAAFTLIVDHGLDLSYIAPQERL